MPRRLGRRGDQLCAGIDEPIRRIRRVADLEGNAQPWCNLPADLDLVDKALLSRICQLEGRSASVEDDNPSAVRPGDGEFLGQPQDVAVESYGRVEVGRLNYEAQLAYALVP